MYGLIELLLFTTDIELYIVLVVIIININISIACYNLDLISI